MRVLKLLLNKGLLHRETLLVHLLEAMAQPQTAMNLNGMLVSEIY